MRMRKPKRTTAARKAGTRANVLSAGKNEPRGVEDAACPESV